MQPRSSHRKLSVFYNPFSLSLLEFSLSHNYPIIVLDLNQRLFETLQFRRFPSAGGESIVREDSKIILDF
jgi:hypothetical protein